MPTPLQNVLAAAMPAIQRIGGVAVTLRRSGGETGAATAVPARSAYQVIEGDTVRIQYTDGDFLFVPAEYAFGGIQSDPLPGDQIEIDDTGERFEVLPLDGRQCFVLSPNRAAAVMLRVHTKRIRGES